MYDGDFDGTSDECSKYGLDLGDKKVLEDEDFLKKFGLCETMTEEDKELWAEKKTEKGQEEKEKKGMNCEKFKDEESLDGESMYEDCLALRALCS
jgi:hypothetical protein